MHARLKFILSVLFILVLFNTQILATLTLTSNSPSVVDSSENIEAFEIKLSLDSIEDISLGDTVDIILPGNLPKLSSTDNDDGKLYVQASFKNAQDTKYKNGVGIKVSIYEHIISIKFISKIQTFTKDDIYENIVPMQDGDIITLKLTSILDIENKANAQYADDGVIKTTTSSTSIQILNNTAVITTPSVYLKITNPSVIFDRVGLGAKSNPKFMFFFKGGLQKDTRIEILFPSGFDIRSLHNLSNYILVNKIYATSNALVDGQKLSFILNENVPLDNIEIDIISFRVTNSTTSNVLPFKIRIYKNDLTYEKPTFYPYAKTSETYFVNDSLDKYSLNDEIHIEFSKPIMQNLVTPSIITLENSNAGQRTFGENYTIQATNYEYGYASKFRIKLDIDANLTKNLNIIFNKDYILTKDGYKPPIDIEFQVPAIDAKQPTTATKSILQTHTKLFASSDIDMLYTPMNNDMPDKATFNDLVFADIDNDGTYSKGDTIALTFSKPVYYPYIEDISSIITLSSDISLGINASIKRLEQSSKLYSDKYILTLGFNPNIKPNNNFIFNRAKVLGEDGSIPVFDVVFSPLPELDPPKAINKITVQDNDDNEIYSSGDKILLQFNQRIKPIDLKQVSLSNQNTLDAKYIIYTNTTQGYSSKFSIKLGEDTQLKAYDKIIIPREQIINKHGIKAGNNEYVYFDAPSLARVKLTNMHFNPDSSALTLEFNKNLLEINSNEIAKKILIIFEGKEHTLASMNDDIISLVQKNKFIYIVFNKQFISSLSEARLDIIVPKNTLSLQESLRLNKEIKRSFYTTIQLENLVANSWNLVSLEDKLADTTIKNIKDTGKVNQVYVFDIKTNDWVIQNSEIVRRGRAIWINPKVAKIDNIIAIKPQSNFKEKTSILNDILYMKNDIGYYLGNSVKNCNGEKSFTLSDIKPLLLDDIQAKIITFDANTTLYNEKATSVKPCHGFIVIKSQKP